MRLVYIVYILSKQASIVLAVHFCKLENRHSSHKQPNVFQMFYGQSWFLSLMSGIIATVIYYLSFRHQVQKMRGSHANMPDDTLATGGTPSMPTTNTYLCVFLVVAILVYGSFAIADNVGTCRFVDVQPDIMTGGAAPF